MLTIAITAQDVGPPEKLISGFAPELFGVPIAEEDVVETASVSKDGCSYYQWCALFRFRAAACRLRCLRCALAYAKNTLRLPEPIILFSCSQFSRLSACCTPETASSFYAAFGRTLIVFLCSVRQDVNRLIGQPDSPRKAVWHRSTRRSLIACSAVLVLA